MPDLWMPGALVRPARLNGGTFPSDHEYGKRAYGTLHTFQANPHKLSAEAGARYLDSVGYSTHFVLNPVTGQIVQTIPANRAGRGLREDGSPRTNRAGRVHFQVEVIAYAETPFTSYWTPAGRDAVHALLRYWNSWGVTLAFPNGPLAATYAAAKAAGHRIAPGPSGLYGHSDWLDNDHWDPGALDARSLLPGGAPTVTATTPTARVKMLQELLEVPVTGEWDAATEARSALMVRYAPTSAPRPTGAEAKVVQAVVDVETDGVWVPKSEAALAYWIRSVQRWLGVADDGLWGPNTAKAYAAARGLYKAGPARQTTTPTPFPLRSGEWYGMDDGTPRSHSGARPADVTPIRRIQQQIGVSADGRFGPATASAVKKKQKALGVDADGKVGRVTWTKMFGG